MIPNNRPQSFWKNIVWSDQEKLFGNTISLFTDIEKKTVTAVKHGRSSIMVWAALLDLIPDVSNLSNLKTIAILEPNVLWSIRKFGLESSWIFNQDDKQKD